MGHGFGELYKGMRGIITYRISPFEQKAFAKIVSHGLPNTIRRFRESVLYVVPRKYAIIRLDILLRLQRGTWVLLFWLN